MFVAILDNVVVNIFAKNYVKGEFKTLYLWIPSVHALVKL